MRRRGLHLAAGLTLLFAVLPWLGLGSAAFVHPLTDRPLPRLHLLSEHRLPGGKLVKSIVWAPAELLGSLPYLDHVVHFAGEGSKSARPIVVSHVWLLVGVALIAAARTPRPLDGDDAGPRSSPAGRA